MASNTPPTPLEQYQAATAMRRAAAQAAKYAEETLQDALAAEKEAEYRATVAVPCPAPSCGAQAGEPCRNPGKSFHRYVTHGVRQEVSGIHGRVPSPEVIAGWYGAGALS
jgi:hypothetical protein